MISATERHSILIDHGWTTRADGLMRPPADWHDRRAYTPDAAWHEHQTQHTAKQIEQAIGWTDDPNPGSMTRGGSSLAKPNPMTASVSKKKPGPRGGVT